MDALTGARRTTFDALRDLHAAQPDAGVRYSDWLRAAAIEPRKFSRAVAKLSDDRIVTKRDDGKYVPALTRRAGFDLTRTRNSKRRRWKR